MIDEIGTEAEAAAARTIAQRGVQLLATAHGGCLDNLVRNPSLVDLVGGVVSVTLGDELARLRGGRKSARERAGPPTFDAAVELIDRDICHVYVDVGGAVDRVLAGGNAGGELRIRRPDGSLAALPGGADAADVEAVLAGREPPGGGAGPGVGGGWDEAWLGAEAGNQAEAAPTAPAPTAQAITRAAVGTERKPPNERRT